ncbi:glycosyltransferase family 4 protein [Candidatus Peregrinibacteria bacterium]|nr:glycosyltransferase family 4 protein [Candidatus Peregrinibacteria bacterium]
MIKVLFYTDTEQLGGAENQMFILTKYLPRDRFQVSLACSSSKKLNAWCQKFMGLGCQVHRLNVFHKHDPRHYLGLKKIVQRFDLLHTHVWNPASGRYGYLAGSKIPLVITEHDPFRLGDLKSFLKKLLMQYAHAIIVASEAAKKIVIEQEPSWQKKIRLVRNGIDVKAWEQIPLSQQDPSLDNSRRTRWESRMEFRGKNFNSRKSECIILCVGELHERKGQKYLIQAVKKVFEAGAEAKLVFAGDGPEKKKKKKMARKFGEKIIFLGRRKDVSELMAAADIFVLPSLREAFGLVLVEAAVTGIPIIATSVGGIEETIENGKTGILVPPADSDALAAAILRIIEKPELGTSLATAAREHALRYFAAERMAEETGNVYEEVIRNL